MKPTPEEWMNNTTSQRRYDWMGVTGYIYGYAKELSKEIKVADVGCSSGVALAGSQLCLNEKGIEMFTVGIDGSSKVGAKAKKNLSSFAVSSEVTEMMHGWTEHVLRSTPADTASNAANTLSVV